MNSTEKEYFWYNTSRKYRFSRIVRGVESFFHDPGNLIPLAAYGAFALILWYNREFAVYFLSHGEAPVFLYTIVTATIPIAEILGLLKVLEWLGTPIGWRRVSEDLACIGFTNHAGEPPILIERRRAKENKACVIMEFDAQGLPLYVWQENRAEIESALNRNIVDIKGGKDKRRIELYTLPAKSALPQKLLWKDEYLSRENFVLRLGESLYGAVTVNLAQIPHILLGGSTGSGKSVLLKLLLKQCVAKGAAVFIADFKGSVDFSTAWHRECRFVTEEADLLAVLTEITTELERRKALFANSGCANIDEYNHIMGKNLPRMIFACDEVAEVLDKTGLAKEEKDSVTKIESKLSVIARQGRAFGIHLILATQRPDATILAGQIRNNIDCRVCGRADNVLSQIILDNTSAAEQIPKDAQGRFIMHDGTVFQGYWVDEQPDFN